MQFQDEQALVNFIIDEAKIEPWRKSLYKRHAEAIRVHSQGQIFYKIDRLFPHEQPESKRHRILSFESITEASFGRAANNINRIFKNSSYTIEASDKTTEELGKDQFDGHNFYSWFLDSWVKWAMKEDPNARFAVYPPEYVKEGNPWVSFVASDFLRYADDETIVFVCEEESTISYQLVEKKIFDETFFDQSVNKYNIREACENTYMPKLVATIKVPVYHVFQLNEGFYRVVQNQQDTKKFDVSFYPFQYKLLPVSDVGGQEGQKQINKSFLHPFVAFGNLALIQHSQHTAVNFTYSFPRMSEVETPCDAEGCNGGKIMCETKEDVAKYPDGTKPCLLCRGTGYKSSQSPYKIYKKKYDPQGIDGEDKALAVPMIEYYTPDVAILDYSKQEWRDYLEMAETAVYIQNRIKTGNVEAAKSKEIDREDLYAFLSEVGKVYFSKLRYASQCFENYLVSSPIVVTVNAPYSYAILSEGEAFTELQNILSSDVPVMIKANRVESFINKFVSQSSPVRKFLEVLKTVDLLLYYSDTALTGYKVSGNISAEAMAIHIYSYPVLQRMFSEDKTLILQDTKVIADKLLKALDEFKPQPQPDLKTKLLGTQGQQGQLTPQQLDNLIKMSESQIQDQPQA